MDKVRFTLRLPDRLSVELEKEAKEKGISLNSLILMILHHRHIKKE